MVRATDLKAMLKVFAPEPLDEENLQDFYYDGTMKNRTGSPVKSPIRRLFDACTSPSSRNAHLFLGHKGCGKSTELNRLKLRFEAEGHPVYIVHANLERDLHQINHWDLMLLITEGLHQIAYDHGVAVPSETLDEIYCILESEIKVTETVSSSDLNELKSGGELKVPLYIINMFASLGRSLKASEEKRTDVIKTMDKRASDWQMNMVEISDHISNELKGRQPIIIIEDLDKLPYPERIFTLLSYSALSQMPFPVIYTFPISQCYSPKYRTIRDLSYTAHTLPMIKVSDVEDRSEDEEGVKTITHIVEKRCDLGLFRKTETIDVLNLLIRKTGGSLRHLFECINYAAQLATWRKALEIEEKGAQGVSDELKIELEDAEGVLDELRIELTRTIESPMFPQLAAIYNDPNVRRQIKDKDFLLQRMEALVVLEYQNGAHWHDLHPLVADYLDSLGELANDKQK